MASNPYQNLIIPIFDFFIDNLSNFEFGNSYNQENLFVVYLKLNFISH